MGITASIDISAEQRQILLDLLSKYLANTKVWAFGSRVKWTTRSNSDLDLVVFSSPEQDSQVSALKEALEESNLPFRVDLLVWDKLPENFQRNIEEGYVVLVEADDADRESIIRSEWMEVRLEDVTSKLGDGLHGTPIYDEDGEYYFINGNNLGDGKILIDNKTKRSNNEEYLKYKKDLNDRTILVSINGTIGNIGLYKGEKVFLGKSACYFNVKKDIDKQFIRYVVTSDNFQHYLSSLANGSTIKNASLKLMRDFTFKLPPLIIQKKISKILEDLDNKIELNRQTNQTLEQIAQALFKSWFVDFEPVKAKIAAKQAGANAEQIEQAALCAISGKTPEQLAQLNPQILQQLKTTAALFPDALVDSELGEIPEGWEINEIKALASVISKGTTPTRGDINGATDVNSVPFLKVRDISNDGIISRKELDLIPDSIHIGVLKRSILKEKDIIFSIAGTIGRVALVDEDLSYSNCNQAIAFIRLKNPDQLLDLCRLNLVGDRVQNEVISKVVQGVQANFSLAGLGEIKLLIPDEILLSQFNKTISSLRKHQRHLLVENSKLVELRDALLPKLISGKVSSYLGIKV